jgi:anti-sigma regulatory factor (Ser/Thr protein kinase)
VLEAQRRARLKAYAMGFGRRACHELAIVASELASNIVKYAGSGSLEFVEVSDGEGRCIAIVATDNGPPFRSFDSALADGHDDKGPIDPDALLRRGGLGAGLGAVVRLTHSFRVEQSEKTKRLVAKRYLGRPLPPVPSK